MDGHKPVPDAANHTEKLEENFKKPFTFQLLKQIKFNSYRYLYHDDIKFRPNK